MKESHAINNQSRGNGTSHAGHEHIYFCKWSAGLYRYLIINIYTTPSMITLVIDETDHLTFKTYENNPKELKRCWTAKRGAVRNFKKKEARWTAPSLEEEWHADGYLQ